MSGVAAVPEYVGKNFKDVPPGHRFGLYLELWDKNESWAIKENPKNEPSEKYQALTRITFTDRDKKQLEAIQKRQHSVADSLPADEWFFLPAESIAPFVTGTGMEHPLENGFAFLNPYGLPYLPASSIKGVLRRAAEELALELYGESEGWSPLVVWWLFGFEPSSVYLSQEKAKDREKTPAVLLETAEQFRAQYREVLGQMSTDRESLRAFIQIGLKDCAKREQYLQQPEQFLRDLCEDSSLRDSVRTRGVLSFWDVYPTPANNRLAVDILNPHYGEYYQGSATPGDFGQPKPVFFLTLPEGSGFEFHVRCDESRLPPGLRGSWRGLLETAFTYAFDWLGFGAKTAVGYGQMQVDQHQIDRLAEEQRQAEMAAQPVEERELAELRKLLDKEKSLNQKDNSGPLVSKTTDLLKVGQDWEQSYRLQLADLAEEIYRYLGWPKNKDRKAKRRQDIADLRR